VVRIPTLVVPRHRPVWVRMAAGTAGRLSASVRFRVLFI
jgi:hypothetical protein